MDNENDAEPPIRFKVQEGDRTVSDTLALIAETNEQEVDRVQARRLAVAAFAGQDARTFALLESAGVAPQGMEAENILRNPEFTRSRDCYDWRNYIPDNVRAVWLSLAPDARAALYVVARGYAGEEVVEE